MADLTPSLWQFLLETEGSNELKIRHVIADNMIEALSGAEEYRRKNDSLRSIRLTRAPFQCRGSGCAARTCQSTSHTRRTETTRASESFIHQPQEMTMAKRKGKGRGPTKPY